jgi:hypothetical protein
MTRVNKILCVYLFSDNYSIISNLAVLFKKIIMLKTRLLLLLLCAGFFASAQVDSTAKKDTSIIDEVKDGLLDNIPIVSIDDNDLGDGGNQNISSLLTAGRDPVFFYCFI